MVSGRDVEQVSQPVLRSERLALVPLAPEHLVYEIELESDSEVMHYLGGPTASEAEIERAHMRRIAMSEKVDGLGFWMAFATDTVDPDNSATPSAERFVGLMMLPPAHGPDQPDDPGVADLGYRLARQAWGRGYGLEAARCLLAHAFETVELQRVIAQTRSDNERSRRLLTTAGLRFVRAFRSLDDHTDGPLDVEYELTSVEWFTRKDRT
jgi:RimJ/RimL family protein N-acetyltransferase